jgi:hypothetical protein
MKNNLTYEVVSLLKQRKILEILAKKEIEINRCFTNEELKRFENQINIDKNTRKEIDFLKICILDEVLITINNIKNNILNSVKNNQISKESAQFLLKELIGMQNKRTKELQSIKKD